MSEQERAERARDFLRRVRADQDACYAVVLATDADMAPEEIDEGDCAALDRVLVAWAVAEINKVMREAGVSELIIREDVS